MFHGIQFLFANCHHHQTQKIEDHKDQKKTGKIPKCVHAFEIKQNVCFAIQHAFGIQESFHVLTNQKKGHHGAKHIAQQNVFLTTKLPS